jgi:5-formyltetrahydrofolate cyclo-ligase
MLNKKEIRKKYLNKRISLTKEFVFENSEIIKRQIIFMEEYISCKAIYIYMNIQNEDRKQRK